MKKKNYVLTIIVMTIMFVNIGVYADNTCSGIFTPKLIEEVKSVFNVIRIVVPILLLLLTSVDFAKVVFSDSKDGMKKAKDNFIKRVVAVLIVFFAPEIIELILKLGEIPAGCVPELN